MYCQVNLQNPVLFSSSFLPISILILCEIGASRAESVLVAVCSSCQPAAGLDEEQQEDEGLGGGRLMRPDSALHHL